MIPAFREFTNEINCLLIAQLGRSALQRLYFLVEHSIGVTLATATKEPQHFRVCITEVSPVHNAGQLIDSSPSLSALWWRGKENGEDAFLGCLAPS